jgi:hypothetical protein
MRACDVSRRTGSSTKILGIGTPIGQHKQPGEQLLVMLVTKQGEKGHLTGALSHLKLLSKHGPKSTNIH